MLLGKDATEMNRPEKEPAAKKLYNEKDSAKEMISSKICLEPFYPHHTDSSKQRVQFPSVRCTVVRFDLESQ